MSTVSGGSAKKVRDNIFPPDRTNYRGLILAPAVAFGVLYLAATFGARWAWPLAILAGLSVLVVRSGGNLGEPQLLKIKRSIIGGV